jgi:putative hydrolase of the HAD superfamily
MQSNVRWISFDVWSTLVKANKIYKQNRVALLAAALGLSDIDAVKVAMNKADDGLDALTIETGMQFGFTDRVIRTCELLGRPELDDTALKVLQSDMSAAFLANLPTLTEDDLPQTLAAIRDQGVQIAVNSNTGFVSGVLMRQMLHSVGILPYVNAELFSDEIGAAKPSPVVFDKLVEVTGCNRDRILHVGDNEDTDYKGALASGLRALLYRVGGNPSDTVLTLHRDLPSRILLGSV